MRGMAKKATIYDVAHRAGVATSTVSRAFSRPGRVNAETAQRIFHAAHELGYRSSMLEGGQRRTHTKALSLVVSDVTNPFYAPVIRGAHEAVMAEGYALLLTHASEEGHVEREIIERSLDLVEGVVLASSRMPDASIRMIAKQRPLILLNRSMPDVASVLIDEARGVAMVAEHLAGLGHTGLTYLHGPETSYADGTRWQALREISAELGLRVHRSAPHPEPTISAGFQAAAELAESGATAVFAYNDALAIGLLKGLKTLGIDVPEQLSVVGFDNITTAQVVDPGLTTVASPLREMGATGVRNVLALIGGARSSDLPYVLPVSLKIRESTAAPA